MEQVREHDAYVKNKALVSTSSEFGSSCDHRIDKPVSHQGRVTGPARRSTKGGWTEEEDKFLIAAVHKFNGKNWKEIAKSVPSKTDVQCLHRWQKVLNPDLFKGPWTKEEDELISEVVRKKGKRNWSEIAKFLPGRIGKQCRERWHNHLNPDIKRTAWTEEEDLTLIKAHQIYGNRWAEIAKFLHGRSENSIKNHWNCSVKKRAELKSSLSSLYSFNFSAESKLADAVKQSSEARMKLNQTGEDFGLKAMSAGENHSQDLDAKTCVLVRTEGGYTTKSQPAATPGQTANQSEEDTRTPFYSSVTFEHSNLDCLCYKPGQLKDLNNLLVTGSFPSTDSYIQNTSIFSSLYTPPNYAKETFVECTSPEYILRTAARNFKNMPSIIRKERLQFSVQNTSSDHFSKVDVNLTKSPRRLHFSPCEKSDVSNALQPDRKQLSLSPKSQKHRNSNPMESLEITE